VGPCSLTPPGALHCARLVASRLGEAPGRRRSADGLRTWGAAGSDRKGRIYDEECAETEIALASYKWYPNRAGRVELVIPRAKETGRFNDPVVRQEIARLLTLSKSAEWTARRARSTQEQGRPQGPEGSLGKLAASHVARAAARVHTQSAQPMPCSQARTLR
jgi:hypothetical protein